ncbi:MAG: hypothetical protein Q9217_000475 [Psora testacea]
MVLSTVRESGWSVALAMAEEDVETTSESDSMDDSPPVHPVPTMQGAFEESMAETMNGEDEDKSPNRYSKADSATRRKMLLEQEQYERTVAGRWKQKPGEKFHPLWKLVAQISFGMHLLQQGLAKSDEEVLKILQTHVDEVDGFLERTTEDFDLAQGDINERIRYLKLPLEHGQIFDQMLADRAFLVAIVEGNEKIEHIIDRTAAAMNDALKDVQKGLDATRELAKYMTRVDKMWEDRTEEHDSVYLAMIGNTEGWTRAFLTLQSKGGHLRKALVRLGGIVAEMQRRAGAASRRNLSPNKPLPTAPDPVARIASSQKFIKAPRSANSSPYANQSTTGPMKPALKKDTSSQAKQKTTLSPSSLALGKSDQSTTREVYVSSQEQAHHPRSPKAGLGIFQTMSPNPNRSVGSPELHRTTRSPENPRSTMSPEPHRSLKSPELQRSTRTLGLQRPVMSPEPIREESPETAMPFKTPAQIMARMRGASKWSVPERSLSRRRSLTERTRSILGRKSSIREAHESGRSTKDTLIQSPVDSSEGRDLASPTLLRRLSSRRKHQAMSTSTYSGSPISLDRLGNPSETPPPREPSPQYTGNRSVIPTQNSYGTLSLLPTQPEFSPLQNSFSEAEREQKTSTPSKSPTTQTANPLIPQITLLSTNVPDDSEGRVNDAHPLLQEARHTRFTTRTTPRTFGYKPPQDLPLRHYHSQTQFAHSNPDLTQRNQDYYRLPKRSSSLLYIPANRHMETNTRKNQSNTQRSPMQDQSTPNASVLNLFTPSTTLPPEDELGIHPAHRDPDPNCAPTTSPSRGSSATSSTTEQGATPPPISTVRSLHTNSPTSGFLPTSTPRSPPQQQDEAQFSRPSNASKLSKTSENLKTPFYLNPASSSALVDFLATTPPLSPPHPGAHTEPGTPAMTSTSGFFRNRALLSRSNDNASPNSPGPGGVRMEPGSAKESTPKIDGSSGTRKKASGWKSVFGRSKNVKEGTEKGSRKGMGARRKDTGHGGERLESLEGLGAVNGSGKKDLEKGRDGGFMGVGKDGVWISRKNFVRH